MARINWKENKVLSIETRKGLFVLAQMIAEPYLVFYNIFKQLPDDWGDVDLSEVPILFSTAIAREFLNSSNIIVQNKIKGEHCNRVNKYWIHTTSDYRTLTFRKGTKDEIEFLTMGHGGMLVEENPYKQIIETGKKKIIQNKINFSDFTTIDKYDLDRILFSPGLNERLYLCYKLRKNVDPLKDFVFDRELPQDYEIYIKLCANKMSEEDWKKLSL